MPDNETNEHVASILSNLGVDAFPQTNYDGQPFELLDEDTQTYLPYPGGYRIPHSDLRPEIRNQVFPSTDLDLLDAFLREKGYLDPAKSEWEQQNDAVQDALYENNMFEQSSRWQGQYDAVQSVFREQEDANIKSIVNVDTTYYSNPRWIQYPPNVRDTSDSSYPGFVKAPDQNRELKPTQFVTDDISTCISVLKLSKNNELLMEYTFYVSPESIEINSPSRVGVYQSIGGATYIDHMGSGVTSITLTGHTGFQRQPSKAFWNLNFGYLQYLLLKKIVNKYNDECAMGNAHLLSLTLTLSFPDAPQYGHWDVSIKDLILRRSIQNLMRMQYTLSLVCVSDNKIQVARPTLAVTRVLPDRPVQAVAPEAIRYVPQIGQGVGPDGRDEYIPAPAVAVSTGPAQQAPGDLGDDKPILKKTLSSGELATVTAPPRSFMYKVPAYPANYDDRYSQFQYKNRNVRLLKNDTTSNSRSKVEYVGTLFDNALNIEKNAMMHDNNNATITASIALGQTATGASPEPLLTIENFTGSLTNYAPLGTINNGLFGNDPTKRYPSRTIIQARTNSGYILLFKAIYLPPSEWPDAYGTLGTSLGRGYDTSAGNGHASRGVYAIYHDKANDKISDSDAICSSQTMMLTGFSVNASNAVSLFTDIELPHHHYEDPSISAVISVASWATNLWDFTNPGFKIQRLVALNSSPSLMPGQSEKTIQPMTFASSGDASKLPMNNPNDFKQWRVDNFFVPIFKDILRKNFQGTSLLTLRGEFKTALANYGQNEGDWYQIGAQFVITLWRNVDVDLTLNQPPIISSSKFGNNVYTNSIVSLGDPSSTKTLTLQQKTTLSNYLGSQNAVGGLLVTTTAGNFYSSKLQFPYMYENTYPGSVTPYTEEAHVFVGTAINGPTYTPTTLNLSRDVVISPDNVPVKSFTQAQDYVSLAVAAAQLPNAAPISNIAGFRADVTFKNSILNSLSTQFTTMFKNGISYFNYFSTCQVAVGTQFVLFPTLSNSMYGSGGIPLSLLDVSKIELLDKTIQWSIDAPRTLSEIVFFFYGYDVNEDQSGGNQQYIDDGAGAFVANPGKQVAQAIVNMNPNLFGDVSLDISLERLIPVLNVVKLPANIPNVTFSTFDLLNTPFVRELQRQDSSFFTFPANPS